MPKPKSNEEHSDYMKRCMSNDEMNNKFPDNKQRYAVCQSYWSQSKDKKTETTVIIARK